MNAIEKSPAEPSGTRHFGQIKEDRHMVVLRLGVREIQGPPPTLPPRSLPDDIFRQRRMWVDAGGGAPPDRRRRARPLRGVSIDLDQAKRPADPDQPHHSQDAYARYRT